MSRDLLFGLSVEPAAATYESAERLVRLADQLGLDVVGIQDHPYQAAYLDTWTLIGFLAARTSRIRFFPDVANLPLRPPAVLAKSLATLDRLTAGRVELGIGAGAFWDAVEAMGGPRRTPGQALGALAEAIQVIRMMWGGERVIRFDGEHYRLAGAHPGPPPAHDIEIWVGGYGDRMMALIGRLADGWLPSSPYLPPDGLAAKRAIVDEAARAAGRDPADVRGVYNIMGQVGGTGTDPFTGPVERWVDELTGLVDRGISGFILWPNGDDPDRQIELFATRVAPEVRGRVEQRG